MTTYEDIYQVAEDTILDLKDFDEDEIKSEMTFEELDLDSLDFIEIQVVIKKKFSVIMKPEAFENGEVLTFGQMCDYVLKLKQAEAA